MNFSSSYTHERKTNSILTLLAVISVTVGVAWAASPHYKRGPNCVDNGSTATCTGAIAGLGNGDVVVDLAFPNATGTTTCSNPQGHQSPGQNPGVPADVSGSALITKVKNGTVSFTVTTDAPTNPTWDAAGCPNSQWTASFNNITFNTGTLTVNQGGGPVLINTVTLP